MRATFILGLNDSCTVTVAGYDAGGQMVYNWKGNASFHHYLDIPPEHRRFISIVWAAEPPRQVTQPDIIINCINDPDTAGKSLKIAGEMVQAMTKQWPGTPVFNDPDKVRATTRDNIYRQFHDLPGLHIPKVARARPESVDHVLTLAAREGIDFPFLIRPCGSHQGENLTRIDSVTDRRKLERYAYDGSEYYLTAFADYRGADGLYRKARLVMLGGTLYPRHYMTGEDWLVHGDLHQTYMAFHEQTRRDEATFIDRYERMIDPRALRSLHDIYARTGLDYLGFDFAVRPDGTLLIFEINPAQNAFLSLDFAIFPYMQPVRDRLIAALNDTVRRKVAIQAVPT